MSEQENWQEVKSSWVKFTKIGDHIIGHLVGVRETPSRLPGQEGQMTKIFEIKATSGEFHDVDESKKIIEEPIILKEGEVWNLGGGSKEKPSVLDAQFRNIKLGQRVKVVFDSEKPNKTKGYNPLKVKKVYTDGTFDEEWLKEQEAEDSDVAPF